MKLKLTEQVEFLPQKLGIRKTLDGKLRGFEDSKHYRHSLWHGNVIPKCAKIIESSVGLHVDGVFSKISKLIPKNFRYSNHDVFSFSINYDERKNEGVEIYRNSKDIYINKDGIITKKPPKDYKVYKSNTRYKKEIEERKQQKLRDVVVHSTLLKIINNKLLYQFYVSLIKDEKRIASEINEYRRIQPSTRKKNDIWKRIENERYANKHKLITATQKQLELKRNDMSKIENGEYNIFYESNVYLYSLQKECHHFEQPIKQKEF